MEGVVDNKNEPIICMEFVRIDGEINPSTNQILAL